MTETWQLSKAIKDTLGAKRFAAAVGRTVQTVYSWSRDPLDPEQDGSTNLFDWMEAVVEALAIRPEGRAVIVRLRMWFIGLTDRALSAFQPRAITRDELAMHTSEAIREFSDLLRECAPDNLDPERIAKEGAEAIDAIQRLQAAVQAGVEEDQRLEATAVRILNERRPA